MKVQLTIRTSFVLLRPDCDDILTDIDLAAKASTWEEI